MLSDRDRMKSRLLSNQELAKVHGKKYLIEELHLSTTKWFDYRFLGPAEATELFAAEYQKAFQLAWRANFDYREAEQKKGLRERSTILQTTAEETTKQLRESTGLWIARQRADTLGIPYDFFIRNAIEAHMRNGRRKIPRPSQLAAGPTADKILATVADLWNDWIANNCLLVVSHLLQYKNEMYSGLPAQDAHHEWVIERLKYGRPYNIGLACFVRRILPEKRAATAFGEHRVAQAREAVAEQSLIAMADKEGLVSWPSCFGLLFAFRAAHPICSKCPFTSNCAQIDRSTRAKFQRESGNEDPRLAVVREQNRIRKREERTRKAAFAASA